MKNRFDRHASITQRTQYFLQCHHYSSSSLQCTDDCSAEAMGCSALVYVISLGLTNMTNMTNYNCPQNWLSQLELISFVVSNYRLEKVLSSHKCWLSKVPSPVSIMLHTVVY